MPQLKLVLRRHADHDPWMICRPALGYGLCEVLEPDGGGADDGSEEGRDAT